MVGKSLVARESGREEQLNDFVRYPIAKRYVRMRLKSISNYSIEYSKSITVIDQHFRQV